MLKKNQWPANEEPKYNRKYNLTYPKGLHETQRNEYFSNKLTTKPEENLRIASLNIKELDLGHGEHSLLQLCLNV